jgi:hypothetical protein
MRDYAWKLCCVYPNHLILCHKLVREKEIMMCVVGDEQRGTIRPEFDRSISIHFQGTKITSDTGFPLMREIDQRFNILSAAASQIDDHRSLRHTDHSLLQLLRQRVYQVAAGLSIFTGPKFIDTRKLASGIVQQLMLYSRSGGGIPYDKALVVI